MMEKQKVNEYAAELGLQNGMTIEQLIESHRRIVQLNKRYHEQCLHLYSTQKRRGYHEGFKQATQYDYISRDTLKSMTLAELVELLRED